jgi:hypothetical protein
MHPIRLCIAVLLLLAAASGFAQTAERRFSLPDHGQIALPAPATWKDSLQQPPNRLPPTITFSPASGNPFQVMVTPLWAPQGQTPMTPPQLRALTEKAAADAKAQAAEPELRILDLQGKSGPGYYFSATDKAPKPNEYKHLSQGILRVGELAVTFTILTNDGQEEVVKQALQMLRGAAQTP